MTKKYFPIHTETACQLKWAWSTVYLTTNKTASCHRTAYSALTPDNFDNFHNTELKISDRNRMLSGQWPDNSCSYCRELESVGHSSDRTLANTIADIVPLELQDSITSHVTPSIVEVYFNNTCNLKCVYCSSNLSSAINTENTVNGVFDQRGVVLNISEQTSDLTDKFWTWFDAHSTKLKRLHIAGGEGFYQSELDVLLSKIDQQPMPNCELNIITNLSYPLSRLQRYVEIFKRLLSTRKLKRVDITCSLDCWGDEQEYVRYGLKLDQWVTNFEYLMQQKWLQLCINQTISVLTIKTMPELIRRINHWRSSRQITHRFSEVSPGPSYLKSTILGNKPFDNTFKTVLSLMSETEYDNANINYMKSISQRVHDSRPNNLEITKMFVYLNEIDRRRGCNWRKTFPWLTEFEKYVVSSDS